MNTYSLLSRLFFALLITLLLVSCNSNTSNNNQISIEDSLNASQTMLVFIGTYTQNQSDTNEKSKGIYLYQLDPKSGELSFVSASPETVNPSYLVIHPNKKWIYSVNEIGDAKENGYLSAFSFNLEKKEIKFINSVSSQGTYPCYISIDHSGKYVMTANYGNGTVASFSIKEDGSLSEAISVHQHLRKSTDNSDVKPHAHMIIQGPSEQIVYSSDLGTDMVWVYNLNATNGKLEPAKMHIPTQTGSGPRHIEFHPNKPWAYVINELNETIEAFATKQQFGVWSHFQTISTLPDTAKGPASCADIHITPSGKFLYGSNRGNINNLAIYEIEQESGELKLIGHQDIKGKTPRNFAIDPTGTFLLVANQNTNNIITFKIDNSTGKLTEIGNSVTIPAPVCIKFF